MRKILNSQFVLKYYMLISNRGWPRAEIKRSWHSVSDEMLFKSLIVRSVLFWVSFLAYAPLWGVFIALYAVCEAVTRSIEFIHAYYGDWLNFNIQLANGIERKFFGYKN